MPLASKSGSLALLNLKRRVQRKLKRGQRQKAKGWYAPYEAFLSIVVDPLQEYGIHLRRIGMMRDRFQKAYASSAAVLFSSSFPDFKDSTCVRGKDKRLRWLYAIYSLYSLRGRQWRSKAAVEFHFSGLIVFSFLSGSVAAGLEFLRGFAPYLRSTIGWKERVNYHYKLYCRQLLNMGSIQ